MANKKKNRQLLFGFISAVIVFTAIIASVLYFGYIRRESLNHKAGVSSISAGSKNQNTVKNSGSIDDSYLILVNKDHKIPEEYNPSLTRLPQKYYYSSSKDNHFEEKAAGYLKNMIDVAKKDGVTLKIISGYRTYAYQQNNLNKQIQKNLKNGMNSAAARSAAAQLVAPPGYSEHETGLSADIINPDWYSKHDSLTGEFDQTDAYRWLDENAADYGFILRYPKDKTSITKYDYEPWHYRFVGIEAARKIKANNQCLEEYLGETK